MERVAPLTYTHTSSAPPPHTHTPTHKHTLCLFEEWGVTINSDLKPDMVGVVGVGPKVKGLQCVNHVDCSAVILTSRPTPDSGNMTHTSQLNML